LLFFFCLLLTVLLATGVSSQAQQPKKVPRIGYLETTASSTSLARHEAFRQGLRELGYVEGKSIVIEWRYAEGKVDRQVSRQDVEQWFAQRVVFKQEPST
jgi:hypothetical protein